MRTKGMIYRVDYGWAVYHPSLSSSLKVQTWTDALHIALGNFRAFGF